MSGDTSHGRIGLILAPERPSPLAGIRRSATMWSVTFSEPSRRIIAESLTAPKPAQPLPAVRPEPTLESPEPVRR
jgi:hypothetical protein